jgi:hypothetical protein
LRRLLILLLLLIVLRSLLILLLLLLLIDRSIGVELRRVLLVRRVNLRLSLHNREVIVMLAAMMTAMMNFYYMSIEVIMVTSATESTSRLVTGCTESSAHDKEEYEDDDDISECHCIVFVALGLSKALSIKAANITSYIIAFVFFVQRAVVAVPV